MGKIFQGSDQDYGMLKIEFPIWKKYFAAFYILLDLGYLGFQKDYDYINVLMPIKKPRKSAKNPNPQLTEAEKIYNKSVSQERIFVENAIAGLKRYNIISNRLRIKKNKYRDDTLFLCASLWNYYLAA
jgi:hypothetical protein